MKKSARKHYLLLIVLVFIFLSTISLVNAPISLPGGLADESPGLLAYLQFEGNLEDKTLNNNDGKLVFLRGISTTTQAVYEPGRKGKALKLEGKYAVELPDRAKVGSLPQFTIMAWVKPEDSLSKKQNINYTPIISEYNSAAPSRYIMGARKTQYLFNPYKSAELIESYTEEFDGKWMHVAAVYNKDSGIKLFINGIKVKTDTARIQAEGPEAAYRLLIGGNEVEAVQRSEISTMNLYGGLIDEVKIYNYALGDINVKQSMEFTCKFDSDCDEIIDGNDNCKEMPNPSQKDSDGNGKGDACENQWTETDCTDGLDNDLDLAKDCADDDCRTSAACTTSDINLGPGLRPIDQPLDTDNFQPGACEEQGGLTCETECGDFSEADPTYTGEGLCCLGIADPTIIDETTGEPQTVGPNCGPKSPAANTCDYYGTAYGVGAGLCPGSCAEESQDITEFSDEGGNKLFETPIDAVEGFACCVSETPEQITCQSEEFISALGRSETVKRTPCIDEDGDGEGYSTVEASPEYFTAIGIDNAQLENGKYNEPCTTLPKGDKAGEIVPFVGYWSLLITFLILILFYT